MSKIFDFALCALSFILFFGIFYAVDHPNIPKTEIVNKDLEPINFEDKTPEEAAEYWVDRMITCAQAGDLDNFYETAQAGGEYQQSLSSDDLERSREATKKILKTREKEFNDAMQVINRAYENADPATKAKMDSFFGQNK